MPEKHYKFGGSTATRTLNCSEWARLSEGVPPKKVGMAASRGTVAHTGFEKMTNSDLYEFEDELGMEVMMDGNKVVIDQAMIDLVNEGIELQEDFFEEHEIEVVHTEQLFEHSEDIGGSADITAWSKAKNIFCVGDLKTGSGHLVEAEDNDQLMFYAWLAVTFYAKDFTFDGNTRIILYILQPVERKTNKLDTWEVNLGDVIAFGKAFELAVRVAESGMGEPTVGTWCEYCPKAATCPARTQLVTDSRRLDPAGDDMETLERAMAIVEDVEQWCRDVRAAAHEQLELGAEVTGWKLVNKRAMRVWNNADEAEKKFKAAKSLKFEDYMNSSLKTPPQMEKVCKDKKVDFKKYEDLFSSVSSGTTLAKADDKRPAALPLDQMASAIAQLT